MIVFYISSPLLLSLLLPLLFNTVQSFLGKMNAYLTFVLNAIFPSNLQVKTFLHFSSP